MLGYVQVFATSAANGQFKMRSQSDDVGHISLREDLSRRLGRGGGGRALCLCHWWEKATSQPQRVARSTQRTHLRGRLGEGCYEQIVVPSEE